MKIGLIVEGHGEVKALPILIRRLAEGLLPSQHIDIPQPHRVSRGKLAKEQELKRAVELMARKVGAGQPILVVLDADGDCPAELGPKLLSWATEQRSDREVSVIVAKEEFEAWFLASADSLRGRRGLPDGFSIDDDPEAIRHAKARLDRAMPTGYSETIDQPALAAVFDIDTARTAPSFDKLLRDVQRLFESAE
jgi:hypothetical protein